MVNESDGKRGNVGKMPFPEEMPKCSAQEKIKSAKDSIATNRWKTCQHFQGGKIFNLCHVIRLG